jgi:hypothetical protein
MMETSSEWIVERTGIEERRWVSEGDTGTLCALCGGLRVIRRVTADHRRGAGLNFGVHPDRHVRERPADEVVREAFSDPPMRS